MFQAIVAECLTDTSIVENMLHAAPKGQLTAVHKLFKSVEGGLSYQYHAAWGLVLQVLATVFQVLGKSCHSIMKGVSTFDKIKCYFLPARAALEERKTNCLGHHTWIEESRGVLSG